MKINNKIKESLSLKYGQIARDLKEQGEDIISMTVGQPNFKTPKYIEKATIKAIKDGFTKYSDSRGLKELRTLIIKDLNKTYQTNYEDTNILVTPGVKSALHLSLRAILKPFDEVIIMSPYYLSYPALIKIAEPNSKIIDVPFLKDGKINKELLKNSFNEKTKCIIVNSPSNPTGNILQLDEIKFISKLAKKYNTFILTDEIYDKLVFKNQKFYSFLKENIKEQVIYTNGYSKSFSMTGYRIGYLVTNNELINQILPLQQNINTNTNTFVQKGACSIYLNPLTHLKPYLKDLELRVKKFDSFLKSSKIFEGNKPNAGFFYFVDISKSKLTSEQMTMKLIKEAKIVVTPGIGFGDNFDDHIRFSLAISDDSLDKAIERLKEFEQNLISSK